MKTKLPNIPKMGIHLINSKMIEIVVSGYCLCKYLLTLRLKLKNVIINSTKTKVILSTGYLEILAASKKASTPAPLLPGLELD